MSPCITPRYAGFHVGGVCPRPTPRERAIPSWVWLFRRANKPYRAGIALSPPSFLRVPSCSPNVPRSSVCSPFVPIFFFLTNSKENPIPISMKSHTPLAKRHTFRREWGVGVPPPTDFERTWGTPTGTPERGHGRGNTHGGHGPELGGHGGGHNRLQPGVDPLHEV